MVFEDTLERRILICKKKNTKHNSNQEKESGITNLTTTTCYYTDIQLGLYLIRGDAIVLMGEVEEENSGENQNIRNKKKNMIPLSLQDFEILHEKNEQVEEEEQQQEAKVEDEKVIDNLIWDFDTDLVV